MKKTYIIISVLAVVAVLAGFYWSGRDGGEVHFEVSPDIPYAFEIYRVIRDSFEEK